MVKESSDNIFENEILKSDKPVLVDFWAEWCVPCRQLVPIIEKIAEEKSANLEVRKHNIDKDPETPAKFGVRSIPTLILFKDGKPVATKVGSSPKKAIEDWLAEQGV